MGLALDAKPGDTLYREAPQGTREARPPPVCSPGAPLGRPEPRDIGSDPDTPTCGPAHRPREWTSAESPLTLREPPFALKPALDDGAGGPPSVLPSCLDGGPPVGSGFVCCQLRARERLTPRSAATPRASPSPPGGYGPSLRLAQGLPSRSGVPEGRSPVRSSGCHRRSATSEPSTSTKGERT